LRDYVRQEFAAYLKCRRREHGFLRVRSQTISASAGFTFDSSEQVRDAVGNSERLMAKLSNRREGLQPRL
jgi:hypothetical protein